MAASDPAPEPWVLVLVDGERFRATESQPLVFGRVDGPGVVGLDANDMHISAIAGSIESQWGVWWVVNQSRKHPLFLANPSGPGQLNLPTGRRHAIVTERINVIVRGGIYKHHLEALMDPAYVAGLTASSARLTSGTLADAPVELSARERQALTALFSDYLHPFPRRRDRPLTYARAAALLGDAWSADAVRKAAERVKTRLASRQQLYFQGPRANDELASYMIGGGILSGEDLACLRRAST